MKNQIKLWSHLHAYCPTRFYLAFENALCKDYVTEKVFNALRLNTIPVGADKRVFGIKITGFFFRDKFFRDFSTQVVFGGGNYSALLPPNSFVDARKFSSPGGFFKKLNNPIKRQFGPNLIQIFSVFLLYWSDLNETSIFPSTHINPTELASYLGKILASPTLWNSYFDWRPHYDITR